MSSDTRKSPVNSDELRRALARFTTGITITTAAGLAGEPVGLTANSFTSVSWHPPLALVCVAKRASTHAALLAARAFAVNVLAEEQKHLSQHFAGKVSDRFHGVAWRWGASGAPLIEGALAQIECQKQRDIDAGDHTILLGEVVHVASRAGRPLLYFESGYRPIG